jgi:hypothetical protein
MAIKKLINGLKNVTTRLKNKTWTNPQIKNHKKRCRLIITQTQHKNPEHIYLKFLTLLTPSVEKTVYFHGFNYIFKPRNIIIVFS